MVLEALKSALGSLPKYAARKSKMSCTVRVPEQLKSAGQLVRLTTVEKTLSQSPMTLQ